MKRLIVLIFITLVLYSCGNEATKNVDKNNAQLDAPLSFVFTEETTTFAIPKGTPAMFTAKSAIFSLT